MEIRCPYCAQPISLKTVRPGQFALRCPKCQEKFALIMPEGEGAVPTVKAIKNAAAPAMVATVATPGATAPPKPSVTAPAAAARPTPGATALPAPAATKVDAPRPSRAAAEVAVDEAPMPSKLGGYQIVQKLGQGGMGSVYLARQLSLDRNVAVKVLSLALAEDAGFVARFTREAYAAAQLTHHNIVQVYDIGEDAGRHFYSMEFVEGDTLSGLVAKDGKLDPEAAVRYVLQAARGLKFAHDQGLIHRDVKPDNLMLNEQGIVKVADLGLVKKRGLDEIPTGKSTGGGGTVGGRGTTKLDQAQSANTTGFDMSMGTPAYMAPEQARDAAHVDGRADIYSLGCTLYDLLTGRPPFSGKTALEVMTKHASEPITPPEVVASRVPKELSAVLLKMVAKKPEDRYRSMDDCIRAMEDFLGAGSGGPFTPKEQHAAALELAAKAFNGSALARARGYLVPGFFIACAVLALLAALFGSTLAARINWTGAYVGLALLAVLGYIILTGITRRNIVFLKLRQFVLGARLVDWLKFLLVAVAAVGLLYVFNLLTVWIGVAIAAFALAAALHFGLELLRDRQRKIQIDQIEGMLRTMRMRGLDEDSLRQFVCRYAGQQWEEFYEALFGYEAKLEARRRWGTGLRGKPRPKFGAWRDALVGWVDGQLKSRQEARERKLLAKIEEKRLIKAEGMDLLAARKAARKQANKLVDRATTLKQTIADARSESDRRNAATAGPAKATGMGMDTAQITVVKPGSFMDAIESGGEDSPEDRKRQGWLQRRHGGLLGLILGPTVRFPIALALLAFFFLWFHKVNPDFPQNAGALANETIENVHGQLSGEGRKGEIPTKQTRPNAKTNANTNTNTTSNANADWDRNDVLIPGIPRKISHQLSGYPSGLAGAFLLFSCLVRGWKVGFMTLAGAAVMLIASRWLPGIGRLPATTLGSALGVAVCMVGFLFGRGR